MGTGRRRKKTQTTYGRGNETQGTKHNRKIDFSPHTARNTSASNEPDQDGRDRTDEESPYQWSVEPPFPKESLGTDDAPQNAAIEMYSRDRTGEAVDGLGSADALNMGKHPVQDSDLRDTGDKCGRHLDFEEDFRRNLHVMAELEVGGELEPLGRADVAKGNKNHVRNRTTGENDTADELADQVRAALLVRDRHDDPDRNEENSRDRKSKDEAVPGQMDWVVLYNEDANSKRSQEGGEIPRERCILVAFHQPVVYIFVAHGAFVLRFVGGAATPDASIPGRAAVPAGSSTETLVP